MVPTITAFMAAHQLKDVTVVADAGMISAANQRAIGRQLNAIRIAGRARIVDVDPAQGASVITATLPLERTGAFGYTVRVLPHSEHLADPAELGVVTSA